MTRMALLSALVFVVLSVLSYFFGNLAVFCLTAFFLFLVVLCFVFKRKIKNYMSTAAVLVLCATFGVYLVGFNHFVVEKTEKLAGQTANVNCEVVEEPENHGSVYLVNFKATGVTNENGQKFKNIKLQMWVDAEDQLCYSTAGDTFSSDVEFEKIDEAYRKSSSSIGMYVTAEYKNVELSGHKTNLYEYAIHIRQAVRDKINQNFSGDKRGILNGIVLGDNRAMSDELYSDFISSGVIHITAVSGLHISVICSAITTLLQLFMRRRRAVLVATIPTFMVIAVTGFHASAIRAGVMCLFAFLGEAFLKKTDGLNSLGVAVIIMLIIHPYYVCDLGFGLSCTATAGVIVAAKVYRDSIESLINFKNNVINKIFHTLGSIFLQSIGAVIFTLPLQVIELGHLSLAAPLGGIAICSIVSYSLIIAVFGLAFSFIPVAGVVSKGFFAVLWVFLEYIETVIPKIADIPFSYIAFSGSFVLVWMGASFSLIAIWLLCRKIGGKKLVALLISLLLVVSLWCSKAISSKTVEISSINLGQGYCVVIYSGEKCVIIGCGDDKYDATEIYTELRLHGVTTVEAMLLPSDYDVCSGGADRLCELSRYDNAPYLPKTDEIHENIIPNVNLAYKTYEQGCYYEATVFDKTVVIGCGSYELNLNPDLLFTGKVLPNVEYSDTTVISGGRLPDGVPNNFGKTYYSDKETLIFKISNGKEITAYARQDRFRIFN